MDDTQKEHNKKVKAAEQLLSQCREALTWYGFSIPEPGDVYFQPQYNQSPFLGIQIGCTADGKNVWAMIQEWGSRQVPFDVTYIRDESDLTSLIGNTRGLNRSLANWIKQEKQEVRQ